MIELELDHHQTAIDCLKSSRETLFVQFITNLQTRCYICMMIRGSKELASLIVSLFIIKQLVLYVQYIVYSKRKQPSHVVASKYCFTLSTCLARATILLIRNQRWANR